MRESDRSAVDEKTIRLCGRLAIVLLVLLAVLLTYGLLAAAPKGYAQGAHAWKHESGYPAGSGAALQVSIGEAQRR